MNCVLKLLYQQKNKTREENKMSANIEQYMCIYNNNNKNIHHVNEIFDCYIYGAFNKQNKCKLK